MRMQPSCPGGNHSTRTGETGGLGKAGHVCAEPYHNLIRVFALDRSSRSGLEFLYAVYAHAV